MTAPTPSTVNYVPKCGQRNKDGLGVKIQGLNNYESQFGEWPHMCAILAEEVISPFAQDFPIWKVVNSIPFILIQSIPE